MYVGMCTGVHAVYGSTWGVLVYTLCTGVHVVYTLMLLVHFVYVAPGHLESILDTAPPDTPGTPPAVELGQAPPPPSSSPG